MKREVAALAGYFRGVCPLTGRNKKQIGGNVLAAHDEPCVSVRTKNCRSF